MNEELKDSLMDEAQVAIVDGMPQDEIVAALTSRHGLSQGDAAEIVTMTASHPITRILISQKS